MKKNAIFFAISDFYLFGAANVIMGLKKHSSEMLENCDILIFCDEIAEEQKELFKKIHPNIAFRKLEYPPEWSLLIDFKGRRPQFYGYYSKYIYAALLETKLLDEYEKCLYIDADMHIKGDISELFEIKEAIAWRETLGWNVSENFASIDKPFGGEIKAGSGGLYVFTSKLKEYGITTKDVLEAYETVKELLHGGLNENIMSWLVYSKGITVKELDCNIYNTPVRRMTKDTKIVHFLDVMSISTKPWKNLAAYLWFDDWVENYNEWIALGGSGPVNYTKEDYYNLFAFDKAQTINKLKNEKKKLEQENKKLREKAGNYQYVINSKSWKLTKPLRVAAKTIKQLKKKTFSVKQ